MGAKSKFLATTMIFWVPILFFTTYIGFYEAYNVAMQNEFLGLKYPRNYSTMLIIPSMIPTMFTAYSILNREKNTLRLIEKFNIFHDRVVEDNVSDVNASLLTEKEYNSLNVENQLQYCTDIRMVGKYSLADKYLKKLFTKNITSKNPRHRSIAYFSKTLVNDGSITHKSMYESSKKAYDIICKENNKDSLYYRILWGFILEMPYLGYEENLRKIRDIEGDIEDNYFTVKLEMRKLYLLWRMKKINKIDFDHLDNMMDFKSYNDEQRIKIEKAYSKLKGEILLENHEYDELYQHIMQRRYYLKWQARDALANENRLGRLYRTMGKFSDSLEVFYSNLTSARTQGIPLDEGIILVNLGKTYFVMKDYQKTKEYANHGFQIFSKLDFARGEIESLTLIVNASKELGDDCSKEEVLLNQLTEKHGIIAQID